MLKKDASRIQKHARQNFALETPQPYEEVRPLVIRANAGDWIEVTLHNLFDPKHPVPYFDYPTVPLDMPHKPSMRVSLNPQFLYYDPVCDSGINVGYNNREQTVGVGESKRYLWHADQEYGACLIQSFGDMRNHRYHGLFANRLKKDSRISRIFNSRIHGDPATSLFKAYVGDRVIFRTMMPADKPRNVGFCIHGTQWKAQPHNPASKVVPLQGAISIGNTFQMELQNGTPCPGDYLYRSSNLKWDVESGMWGIFRVLKQGFGCKCRNLCRKAMASSASRSTKTRSKKHRKTLYASFSRFSISSFIISSSSFISPNNCINRSFPNC